MMASAISPLFLFFLPCIFFIFPPHTLLFYLFSVYVYFPLSLSFFHSQIQIPADPPPSIFTNVEDGPGWAILMYYRISEVRTCAQAQAIILSFSCFSSIYFPFFTVSIFQFHFSHYFCFVCYGFFVYSIVLYSILRFFQSSIYSLTLLSIFFFFIPFLTMMSSHILLYHIILFHFLLLIHCAIISSPRIPVINLKIWTQLVLQWNCLLNGVRRLL